MRTNISIVVAAYVRLSVDEAGKSVSGSIENQISLIKEYCAKRELIVAAVFQDDGWSGGNFERPGFKKLLEFLRKKSANTVITVDLSRLGRNMREASYYAEEYFPEHGIHFFTISDGFDTARENVFAPFQFAMNEVYLRDGSRKVKNVLKNKRESGQYCACPPYGYKKNPDNVHQLIPDEVTAPVVQRIFAALNLGKGTRNYQKYDHVRKSIFSGIAVCGRCGHSLCSCGTVYKGEREKYWYLSCTRQRPDIADPCEGVRIRYSDLLEVVRQDLNEILAMTDEQIDRLVGDVLRETQTSEAVQTRQLQQERAAARLKTIDRVITKLYMDNAEGRLEDARLSDMVSQLQTEGAGLQRLLTALEPDKTENAAEDYQRFFALARRYTHIEKLDRETLSLFVERIEIGPKELPQGIRKSVRREQPFCQSIRIFYRFVGELAPAPVRSFPLPSNPEPGKK